MSSKEKISLLMVEDHPTSRSTQATLLARRYPALEIHSAENGEAGLALYREHRHGIVLTDINMPVMDGIRMTREIRSLNPSALIIVLTSHSDTEYLLDAIRLGVSHYVMKPIDRTQLFDAVDHCLQRIREQREIEVLNALVASRAADLEQLNADLNAANRELESFNSMIAHDLRQPMQKISLYCQVLSDSADLAALGDDSRSHLRGITDNIQRMDCLIDSLLDLAQITHQELKREKVDLSNMAVDIAAALRLQQPERQVYFDIDEGTEAYGDARLLRVVLDNLMGNAWKFTSKKASACIEFKRTELKGKPVYYIRDNGVGFDAQNPSDLFAPFRRQHTSGEYQGHGIGLFTVQKIVQRHGGKVWAEGAPARGATFFFALEA